jgi:predicted enzyme related to lactoylglutathione lyase
MPGPARAGLFIYAKDLPRLARFYAAVGGMVVRHETAEMIVLESPDIQLLVHRIPPAIAAGIEITVPPQRREDTALKFFFSIESLAETRAHAEALGGEVGHEHWPGPGFTVCNAMDPEGNVFQVREWRAAAP